MAETHSHAGAIDLSQLAVKRDAAPVSGPRGRGRWLSRYVLPMGILAGFAGLFAWAARDSFLPAHVVTITPVIVTRAEVQEEGTPLFQAAGWIEPRPTATEVTSLVAGVVESLLVVEGQLVERDQVIAKLLNVDAKFALQQAEANKRLAAADVMNAEAMLVAARTALENPNGLRAELADAESMLAELKLTLGNLPFAIEAATNRRQLAADNVDRKRQAGDAVAGRVLREAEAELAAAESGLAELGARGPTLAAQSDALERKRAALDEQLRLMTEQKRAVAVAEASLAAAQARLEQADLSVYAANLTLQRMTIRAPMAGRVLTLDARPGTRLAGMDPVSQHSGAVISLYDPHSLQVRVDVRLEDVPQVQIGQPVSIETAASSGPLTGKVSWITTRADIQKNTLQVKVEIDDPPLVVTPEMLAQVTFIAPPREKTESADGIEPLRMLVPRALIVSDGNAATAVWIADPAHSTARLRTITVGRAGTEQLVEVTDGLDPTNKLIVGGRESLTNGVRIRISGEDATLGAGSAVSAVDAPKTIARTPSLSN